MAKDKTCRCLTNADDKELHQFADVFSRYMKSQSREPASPSVSSKVRRIVSDMKRTMEMRKSSS